eukprot:3203521-Rhodomonas_salina.1
MRNVSTGALHPRPPLSTAVFPAQSYDHFNSLIGEALALPLPSPSLLLSLTGTFMSDHAYAKQLAAITLSTSRPWFHLFNNHIEVRPLPVFCFSSASHCHSF